MALRWAGSPQESLPSDSTPAKAVQQRPHCDAAIPAGLGPGHRRPKRITKNHPAETGALFHWPLGLGGFVAHPLLSQEHLPATSPLAHQAINRAMRLGHLGIRIDRPEVGLLQAVTRAR